MSRPFPQRQMLLDVILVVGRRRSWWYDFTASAHRQCFAVRWRV